MNRTLVATGLAIFVLTGSCSEPSQRPPLASRDVVWTNVTVVDVLSGDRHTGMTVSIQGDRITQIGRGIAIPDRAVKVDGSGQFLIPGLWDMHTHQQMLSEASLDLFLANGVVGTRDMGSEAGFILSLRDRINRGAVPGPEIVAAGPILDNLLPADSPPPETLPETVRYFAAMRRRVANADDARRDVRELKKRGVDFIKVHDNTPRDAFFAIADEAARLGLPFAGHVPRDVSVEEAIESGIRSIEHLANFRVFRECAAREPSQFVSCRDRFDRIAARGTYQTPTIAFTQAIPDLFSGRPLAHAEYASEGLLASTRGNAEFSNLSERALASFRADGTASLAAIRDMQSRGVAFLAACDALVPGFCLHDELEWMTKAGLSPLQALQTATINPARFLGRESSQGTVAIGKRADLIALDADPLLDIRNTRRIAAVLVRGRLLSRVELDRMTSAHRRAGSH